MTPGAAIRCYEFGDKRCEQGKVYSPIRHDKLVYTGFMSADGNGSLHTTRWVYYGVPEIFQFSIQQFTSNTYITKSELMLVAIPFIVIQDPLWLSLQFKMCGHVADATMAKTDKQSLVITRVVSTVIPDSDSKCFTLIHHT